MDSKRAILFLTILISAVFAPQLSSASPVSLSQASFHYNEFYVKVHSWRQLERQRRQGAIQPEKSRRFFRNGGGWRDFKRRHRRAINRFRSKSFPNMPWDQAAFYFYNYKFGYWTDNCEFIKAPARYCWYKQDGKRECRFRSKWQYLCY